MRAATYADIHIESTSHFKVTWVDWTKII